MAVVPRDFQVTRDQVASWLSEYKGKLEPTAKMRAFLEDKISELQLEDELVSTTAHDDLGDSTHVVDMILMDLRSYV